MRPTPNEKAPVTIPLTQWWYAFWPYRSEAMSFLGILTAWIGVHFGQERVRFWPETPRELCQSLGSDLVTPGAAITLGLSAVCA